MINANEIEKALIAKLANDSELLATLPDGVYWDLAKQGATKFVIVSLSTSRGLAELADGETLRALIYLVKAVVKDTSGTTIAAAEARIHTLLNHGALDLPPAAGATLMIMRWIDRIRYTELVAGETWQHRGARYEVTVTPN